MENSKTDGHDSKGAGGGGAVGVANRSENSKNDGHDSKGLIVSLAALTLCL